MFHRTLARAFGLGFSAAGTFRHAVAVGRRISMRVCRVMLIGFGAADGALPSLRLHVAFCAFHSAND